MCGIIGVYDHKDAAYLAYLGLLELQHRGEQGAGIAAHNGTEIIVHKGEGLVSEIFADEDILRPKPFSNKKSLEGIIAIGGNRYSTVKYFGSESIQPLVVEREDMNIATAHNGTISNYKKLKSKLEKKGATFSTKLDSEIFKHLLAQAKGKTIQEKIHNSFDQVEGAYSLVIMNEDKELIGVRDPKGFRPLHLGFRNDTAILSSETGTFDIMNAKYEREIKPGEVITINQNNISSSFLEKQTQTSCIFELVYFARQDSAEGGKSIGNYRIEMGKQLALEDNLNDADYVIAVPDSGNLAAMGYSQQSGIPFRPGLIKSHYATRTFIQPEQNIRDIKVKRKLKVVKDFIEGKKIVVVDDSIVRGTTSKALTKVLRSYGASEIHLRLSYPPVTGACYYGMDFPNETELFANNRKFSEYGDNKLEKMAEFLGVNSIRFISPDGLRKSVPNQGYCTACYSGSYPTKIPKL